MTGKIATEIGLLSNLQMLGLGYNSFSGTIPSQTGKLTALNEIDLWGNSLEGTIPDELYLGGLDHLWALILGENNLSGTISSYIGELLQLIYVVLRGNPLLVGTLPTEISDLQLLLRLDVDGTGMTGAIPEEVCNQVGEVFLSSFRADCLPLASDNTTIPMPCPIGCCSKCCDRETGECVKMN